MATDLIRYDLLVQDALRSVVRKVLADTARNGLVGDHHFNIAFKTQAPGVIAPPAVKQRFPDEMSIILQHEFWDLVVTQDAFEVSLNFSRKPERLTVPFNSITGFTDPSVPFGFKLEPRVSEAASRAPPAEEEKGTTSELGPDQANAGQAVRPARLRSKVRSRSGKARGARRRNEGRVDRRLPQEIGAFVGRDRQSASSAKIEGARASASGSRSKSRRLWPLEGREASHRERARARRGEPRRPPPHKARWRPRALTHGSSSARSSSLDIERASPWKTRFGGGCAASRPSVACPSIVSRR